MNMEVQGGTNKSLCVGTLFERNSEKFRQHPFHGIYIFQRPVMVINDPELIKIVLVKEFSRFCDRGWFVNDHIDPMSGNLFLLTHEKWSRLRKKFTPTFTPGKLRKFHTLMVEVSNEMIPVCDKQLKDSNVLEVKEIIARYTTDIISSVVYGFNSNSLHEPHNEFRRYGLRAFEFGRINLLIATFIPEILEKITIPFYHKEVRNFFAKTFQDTVEYRRKEKIIRHDFMDLLIQLMDIGKVEDDEKSSAADEELKDNPDRISMTDAAAQAFLFFLAGFETSSSTATFCLLELAMHPEIQEKLHQEIDKVAESSTGFTYDSIMEMEYLDMVFSETLRKYPSVSYLNRICIEDFPVPDSNYTIPKGMRIMISTSAVHHNPKFFPNPEKFDPSRFTKENLATISSYVHLGFGAGPRNCIGLRFGALQTKQALVVLLHNYKFYISDKTNLPLQYEIENFVQSPNGGVYLRFERRRNINESTVTA